ncbi:hypothetical protein FIC_02575 [Flavobacteriaceae bacterium 3519-10]|nr:hypothetical protein FIC_02575 [Flavobacteriaceae bacterium 3519-10]
MANFQNLQQKVFFEVKTILETLSKVSSVEELMTKQELSSELADRISFLRILDKNEDSFAQNNASQDADHQNLTFSDDREMIAEDDGYFDGLAQDDESIEEEVIFTNEINEIENEPEFPESSNTSPEAETEHFEELIDDAAQEVAYEDRVAQKEQELEARRRQIVEFSKKETDHPTQDQIERSETLTPSEKKFKLAHIKGLKAVQNLFDDDPLEKLYEDETESADNRHDTGSIVKSNIPTDFMEAQRKRTEFRLDLNDKVAFTKLLFKGQEAELTKAIARLNSFDNIEDARQYLSELYYAKDWKKADEYAQRLWNLVENKFM